MRAAAALPRVRVPWRERLRLAALVGGVGLCTVAASVLGGNPLLAAAPVALFAIAYAAVQVPLRWPAAILLTLLLAIDRSSDALGVWHTVLVPVGDLLHANLPGAPVTGAELIVVLLLLLWGYRRSRGSRLDVVGQTPCASAARDVLVLFVMGLLYAMALGVLNGYGPAFWKFRNNVHIPAYFLLFQAAFRGPPDHRLIGRIMVIAGCAKAALAIFIQRVIARRLTGGPLAFGTNHGDSILFAVAVIILVVRLMEEPDRHSKRQAAYLLPLLLMGMVDNGRRTAWVILGMSLIVAVLMTPRRPWKVMLARWAVVLAPVLALYVAIGWKSGSALFAPVQMVRSVGDSSADESTRWRDVENWNICSSIREHPLLGIGLGGEYTEYMRNASIAEFYPDYRGWPHNSVLGLILLCGAFGFTAVWAVFVLTVYLAARSHRMTNIPEYRVVALTCITAVIGCIDIAFGDTGANLDQYATFAGLALAVAGKLAVATGAWPARPRKTGRAARSAASEAVEAPDLSV